MTDHDEYIRREVEKAPPLTPAAADLLRRLGCPVAPKREQRESA